MRRCQSKKMKTHKRRKKWGNTTKKKKKTHKQETHEENTITNNTGKKYTFSLLRRKKFNGWLVLTLKQVPQKTCFEFKNFVWLELNFYCILWICTVEGVWSICLSEVWSDEGEYRGSTILSFCIRQSHKDFNYLPMRQDFSVQQSIDSAAHTPRKKEEKWEMSVEFDTCQTGS